jgi:16S rRNA (guanine527-N7)-methyltransferase
MRLLLVESVGKKTEFLQHVVDVLGLENVEVSTARAEALGQHSHYREQFEAVTARAVATLNVLAEYCLPLCSVGGLWVAPKSAEVAAEVTEAQNAFQQLGGKLQEVRTIHLPDIEERTLVVVRKVQRTITRFPRRVGVATKRPL